nr:(4Fe-4S)-binding protein [Herpetosiphonaceae bacterium]
MTEKKYTNDEITVVWKPEQCSHSTLCWKGLGQVFNPKVRPWVTLAGASSAEIATQVDRCPSGALSWQRNAAPPQAEPAGPPMAAVAPVAGASIEVKANGPLLVRGGVNITHRDGRTTTHAQTVALCR